MTRLRAWLATLVGEQPAAPTDARACARTLARIGAQKRAHARSQRVWAHIAALKASPDYPPNKQVPF